MHICIRDPDVCSRALLVLCRQAPLADDEIEDFAEHDVEVDPNFVPQCHIADHDGRVSVSPMMGLPRAPWTFWREVYDPSDGADQAHRKNLYTNALLSLRFLRVGKTPTMREWIVYLKRTRLEMALQDENAVISNTRVPLRHQVAKRTGHRTSRKHACVRPTQGTHMNPRSSPAVEEDLPNVELSVASVIGSESDGVSGNP